MRIQPLALPLTIALALAAGSAHAFTPAGQDIVYDVNGEAFEGYLASAEGESRGSVLIIHDWDGLDGYERQRADMLAEQGYDAFAVDLYGQGNHPEDDDARKAETARLYEDRERMRTLTLAGLGEARARGAAEGVQGYASFHGALATPEGQQWPDGVGPILIAHGGADGAIPMSQVATLAEELEAAEATYEIQVYSGAPHGFTEFGSDAYRERADAKSWAAFLALLEETL